MTRLADHIKPSDRDHLACVSLRLDPPVSVLGVLARCLRCPYDMYPTMAPTFGLIVYPQLLGYNAICRCSSKRPGPRKHVVMCSHGSRSQSSLGLHIAFTGDQDQLEDCPASIKEIQIEFHQHTLHLNESWACGMCVCVRQNHASENTHHRFPLGRARPTAQCCHPRLRHKLLRTTSLSVITESCQVTEIWLWLKIKLERLRGFWSMFLRTKVPFWYQFVEPQPYVRCSKILSTSLNHGHDFSMGT